MKKKQQLSFLFLMIIDSDVKQAGYLALGNTRKEVPPDVLQIKPE